MLTLKQHRRQFDTIAEAAQDLLTSPPTYTKWLKECGKPKILAHRKQIGDKNIKKWWKN